MSIFFVCNYTVIVNFLSVSTLSLFENICKDIIMFDEAKTVLKNNAESISLNILSLGCFELLSIYLFNSSTCSHARGAL